MVSPPNPKLRKKINGTIEHHKQIVLKTNQSLRHCVQYAG